MTEIAGQARQFLKQAGVDQWQGEYPAARDFEEDVNRDIAYVLEEDGRVIAMAALSFEPEAAYAEIEGAWMATGPYAVIHRMAVDGDCKGRGLAGRMIAEFERICLERGVKAIRTDTHADNLPMNTMLKKNGFSYCGIIRLEYDRSRRAAYEKLLG